MKRYNLVASIPVAVALVCVSAVARGQTQVVDLKSSTVKEVQPADSELGTYYVFPVRIPPAPEGARLMGAYLEFYVDASSRLSSDLSGNMATLEVFALKERLTGEVDETKIRPGSMKRTVTVGQDRRVRLDVGEFVREVLKAPTTNHGLVVGSITGERTGRFVLKADRVSSGVAARVTLHYLPDYSSAAAR